MAAPSRTSLSPGTSPLLASPPPAMYGSPSCSTGTAARPPAPSPWTASPAPAPWHGEPTGVPCARPLPRPAGSRPMADHLPHLANLDGEIERAQAGDEAAFGTLYRTLSPRLLAYIRSIVGDPDADDVVAETWA